MNVSLFNHLPLKKTIEHRPCLSSSSTEVGDSGVASRLTPSSLTSETKLNVHSSDTHCEENDHSFSTVNHHSLLSTPVPIEKRRTTAQALVPPLLSF